MFFIKFMERHQNEQTNNPFLEIIRQNYHTCRVVFPRAVDCVAVVLAAFFAISPRRTNERRVGVCTDSKISFPGASQNTK